MTDTVNTYKFNERMKKLAIFASSFGALALPAIASAQTLSFSTAINSISALIDQLIPLLIGLTILVFFYGLFQYAWQQNEETGRKVMVAGLVALFVMVSVWGLIKLAQGTLFGNNTGAITTPPNVPTVPKPNTSR